MIQWQMEAIHESKAADYFGPHGFDEGAG
jgi:hypothetical protein